MDGHDKREEAASPVAIARVELLYPFARDQIRELIERYPNLKHISWVQEEPKNMGAYSVMARRMPSSSPKASKAPTSAGRSAPPPRRATRSPIASEQERIVLTALAG